MKLRIERSEPGTLELASIPRDIAYERLLSAGLTLLIAGLPAAWLLVFGVPSRPWLWTLLLATNFVAFVTLSGPHCKMGRLIFSGGEVVFEGVSIFIPFLRSRRSWPLEEIRLNGKFMRRARAILSLDPAGGEPSLSMAGMTFNVAGIWRPRELERLRWLAGFPGPEVPPPPKCASPPWGRLSPAGLRILQEDETTLEYRIPQSAALTGVFLLACAFSMLGGILSLRVGSPASILAGAEASLGALLFSIATFRAMGFLRVRVDSKRREVVDLKEWPYERVPFDAAKYVILRQLEPGSWNVTLIHHGELMLALLFETGVDDSALEAFAGEIARRIGVPLLKLADEPAGRRDHE